jgi:hypothetical protein
MPLITDSSTLAPNEVNANTELYMRIQSQNLMTLLSLQVKRTSRSCDVGRRLAILATQKKLWVVVARLHQSFLIHIFTL